MVATTQSIDEFLTSVRSSKGRGVALSPDRLADAFGMSKNSLATLAGVHRNTVRSRPDSEKLQSVSRNLVRVLSAAHGLAGDMDKAIFWVRNHPIAEFDHLTALELVSQGHTQAVVDYIESISSGSIG